MNYLFKSKIVRKHKHHLWPALAVIALLAVALSIILIVRVTTKKTSPVANPGISSKPVDVATTPTPTTAAPVEVAPVPTPVAQVPAPQNCTPYATFDAPPQLNLANQPAGLTQVIQGTMHYQIFGNTAAQIRSQIKQCAPNFSGSDASEFAGATDYSLSWKYSTTSDSTGACSTHGVKVGLHVNMIQPQWQPTADATAGLAGAWQKFIANLSTHENGHVSIDQQYANQLLRDLQAYPVSDCAAVAGGIQTKVFAAVAAIGAANDAYDARTNHGVTQGAIIP